MENRGIYFENIFCNDINPNLQDLSDAKLRTADGRSFDIHKFALAKNSKYFYAMFCGIGKGKNDILVPGIRGEVLSNVLSYIYTGNIHVTEENICDLIVASDYLLLDDLLSQLKAFLTRSLSVTNCVSIYMAALKINREDVSQESFRFIQTHFEAVVHNKRSDFGEMPFEVLQLLLSDNNLSVKSELTVWLAIVKWVEADRFSRIPCVPGLLMYLAVDDMDEITATEILEHEIVAKSRFCQEISQMKSNSAANNLKIFESYFWNRPKPFLVSHNNRLPTKLHFIAHYCTFNGTDGIGIYITYDEKIDLWRKILDIDFSFECLFAIYDCIYMFRPNDNTNYRFNVVENRWVEIGNFRTPRYHHGVVKLNGYIYILGGISAITGNEICDVEVYDPIGNFWFETTPMLPLTSFAAVSLNNSIYVVGSRLNQFGYETVAEVYDSLSETWIMSHTLATTRFYFALVAYHGKIFVIGGTNGDEHLKNVEVFDTEKNEWLVKESLPYVYYLPKTLVLNDQLIVYDNHLEDRCYLKTSPPVLWNDDEESWESFDDSSPMNSLYMYNFFTLDNSESIKAISKINRDTATIFEKSPFNK